MDNLLKQPTITSVGLPVDALVWKLKTEHEHDPSMMDLDPSQRPG